MLAPELWVPLAARAQQPERMRRVGVLMAFENGPLAHRSYSRDPPTRFVRDLSRAWRGQAAI
jgi:hypothetical protein